MQTLQILHYGSSDNKPQYYISYITPGITNQLPHKNYFPSVSGSAWCLTHLISAFFPRKCICQDTLQLLLSFTVVTNSQSLQLWSIQNQKFQCIAH